MAVFQLLYSFSLKGASALTDAWLGRPRTFCTQFTWGQQTWEVGWIPGVPFRTRCGPREATGVPWLSQCSCSSWTWKQGSPGPLLQSVMGVFFTLLWSLQWHVPVLLWRNWSEQSCIPFCWHMCLWTRGQSSLDYGLIIDFYECGSNFTKMFFVNVSSVPHFPLHFSLPTSNPSAIWSNWWAKTCSCYYVTIYACLGASQVALVVKNPPAMQETKKTQVQFLGQGDPLKEGLAAHSVFLPRESRGQRNLVGYSPQCHRGSDMTEEA